MPIFDTHSYFGGSLIPGVAANATAITSAMKDRGVDGQVLISSHAQRVDPLAGNRILKAVIDQADGLYACLAAHTSRVDASVAAMRELMPSRRFLALALVGPSADDPIPKLLADEIVNAYRRYSKPLFLYTPNGRCVDSALEIARGYPMLKVVFLGMGGRDWRAAIAAAHASTNVLLESSGALDRAKLPAAVESIGGHRILFGSGTPLLDAAAMIGLVEDSDLSEETRSRICGGNARRLFAMAAPEPEEAA